MPTYGQEVKSAQVKLVSVQMPDSAQKGVPFKLTVSAQVTNADSTKGSITVSFSKPVGILIAPSSASAKVYPQGSKLWNPQVKASIESKQPMVELWTEYWTKEMIHQLSVDVTPLEAGALDVFIRATAIDATSGANVNAPPKGVVDQQGFLCEKRTLRILADLTDLIKNLEDPNESIQQEAQKQLMDIIRQKFGEDLIWYSGTDIFLSDIDGDGIREIIASFWMNNLGIIAVVDETLSPIQVIDLRDSPPAANAGDSPIVKTTDLLGEGKLALIIESSTHMGTGLGTRDIAIYQWGQGKFTEVWQGLTHDMNSAEYLGFVHEASAKVQIVDLDQDGIREIVIIGKVYDSAWEEQAEEEQETGQAKVEIEMGYLDDATETFESGYEVVYRFKEIFFWNKAFNRYIQYTARITKDTTASPNNVSIASGTVVGVLGQDHRRDYGFGSIGDILGSNPVAVILPDGQIVEVDKGVLEKIQSEDGEGEQR